MAAMYAELFSGIDQDPRDLLSVSYDEGARDMVTVTGIPFASVCEHHLLPFFGSVHVAYVPTGRVVGISKLARAIECLSRRPQMQERVTNQAVDLLTESLQPQGAAVRVEAEHLCMTIRGSRAAGSRGGRQGEQGDGCELSQAHGALLSGFFDAVYQPGAQPPGAVQSTPKASSTLPGRPTP